MSILGYFVVIFFNFIEIRPHFTYLFFNKQIFNPLPYATLILYAFKFLEPYTRTNNMEHVKTIYEGMLRITLLLFKDFPDFLTTYYQALCEPLPSNCIQLRNIILSAVPKEDSHINNYRQSWPGRVKSGELPNVPGITEDRETMESVLNYENQVLNEKMNKFLELSKFIR